MIQTRRMYYNRMEISVSQEEKKLPPMKFLFDDVLYPCVLCNGFFHEVHCLLRTSEENEDHFYLTTVPPQDSTTVFLPIGQLLELWVNGSPISAYKVEGNYDCVEVGWDEEYTSGTPLRVKKNGYAYGSIRTMSKPFLDSSERNTSELTFSIDQNTEYFMVKFENLLEQNNGQYSVILTDPAGCRCELEQMDTYMPYSNGKGGIYMGTNCSVGQWKVSIQYDSRSEISLAAQILPHAAAGSYKNESNAVDDLAISTLSLICDNALGRYYEFMLPFSMSDLEKSSGNHVQLAAAASFSYWCIGFMKTVAVPFVMAHPIAIVAAVGVVAVGVAYTVCKRNSNDNGMWNGIPYKGSSPDTAKALFVDIPHYCEEGNIKEDPQVLHLVAYSRRFYKELDAKKIKYTIIQDGAVTNDNLKKLIKDTKISYISFKAHGMPEYIVPYTISPFSDIWNKNNTEDLNLKGKVVNFNCCKCGKELAKRLVKKNGASAAFGYADTFMIRKFNNPDSKAYQVIEDIVTAVDRSLLLDKRSTFKTTTWMLDKLYDYNAKMLSGNIDIKSKELFSHDFNVFCGPGDGKYTKTINGTTRTGSCSREYGNTDVRL